MPIDGQFRPFQHLQLGEDLSSIFYTPPPVGDFLLLSGDATDGDDVELLSGDMTDGNDALLLSGS